MHRRLLPQEARAAVEHANEYTPGDPIPVGSMNQSALISALGEPFKTTNQGDQLFRSMGEKAVMLAYALLRAAPFEELNLTATAVIFTAFLYKNGYFWTVERGEFIPSLEALEQWASRESWLQELGETATWIEDRIDPINTDEGDAL